MLRIVMAVTFILPSLEDMAEKIWSLMFFLLRYCSIPSSSFVDEEEDDFELRDAGVEDGVKADTKRQEGDDDNGVLPVPFVMMNYCLGLGSTF